LKRFFPLHQSFFGLTQKYKESLLEEIYVCIKHLGMTYQDVLSAPTYERRYYLSSLINEHKKKEELYDERMSESKNSNARGSRTSRVSGDQLKSKIKSGEIPS